MVEMSHTHAGVRCLEDDYDYCTFRFSVTLSLLKAIDMQIRSPDVVGPERKFEFRNTPTLPPPRV